jgi:hypothetical protein
VTAGQRCQVHDAAASELVHVALRGCRWAASTMEAGTRIMHP